ncbi:MAG: hypothetical protein C5B50_00090 [Verrucomicrobia bacterium]|nr:MAG: hypothetical protein C5B50_00090 [Verrucomicrobiota bacterium]
MSGQINPEETILDAALDLPAEQRAAYLDQVCGKDARLRQLVEGLLKAHGQINAPRRTPADAVRPVAPAALGLAGNASDRIGPYKLLQQIGEGGYGVVYMAEQERPVRRRVALKVIKLGMDTKQVVARFEAERQALALMDHPNIAKVLDAGATETGRPFFVMELVRGIRITDYCDQNNLSTAKRLDLFVQVCNAIQHAHQKGIIHRDVKPSNILVTLHDGVPVPKVIDFGIAKATSGQTLTDKTVFTAFEQFIGTPAYMSPEQAEMSGLDIDTRSDIYALGVLLYELLTGKTPFDGKRLVSAALDELRRIIREEDPPRPSTRLSSLEAGEQTTVARRRQVDAPKLVHLVRGDLDWIVMKCLEKDRTRRYETANGLAMDIQRHLRDEPVTAVAPNSLYKFRKFARRKKAVLAAVSIILLLLVSGTIISSLLAVRANRARAQLRKEQSKTKQAVTRLALQSVETLFPSDSSKALAILARALRDEPGNRVIAERLLNALSSRSFLVPKLEPFAGETILARVSGNGLRIALATVTGQKSALEICDLGGKVIASLPSGTAPIRDLDLSPDGTLLASVTDDRIQVETLSPVHSLLDQSSATGRFRQLRILPGESRLLALSEGALTLYDLKDGRTLTQFKAPSGSFLQMASSEPGGLAAAADEEGTIFLCDLKSLQLVHKIPKAHNGVIRHLDFAPDGFNLISAGADSVARIWKTGTGQRSATLPHAGPVYWAEFSPNGSNAVTASADGTAQLWDIAGQRLGLPMQHLESLNTARFSLDGGLVATAGEDGVARVWSPADESPRSEPAQFPRPVVDALFVGRGAALLVLIERQGAQLLMRTVRPAWEAAKSEPPSTPPKISAAERVMLARGHSWPITCFDVSSDGKFVVTASEDKTARLWSRKDLQPIGEPLRHNALVNCARFSPDNERVITSTANHLVRVWDVRTTAPLTDAFDCGVPVTNVWFAPDSASIITSAGWSLPIHVVRGDCPDWLPELAEAVAGSRYNDEGTEEPLTAAVFLKLRENLLQQPSRDLLTLWAKQFVSAGSAQGGAK